MKSAICFVISSAICVSLCGCMSNDSANAAESIKDDSSSITVLNSTSNNDINTQTDIYSSQAETVIEENPDGASIEYEIPEVKEKTIEIDEQSADTYSRLSEMGIIELLDSCNIWDSYLWGFFSYYADEADGTSYNLKETDFGYPYSYTELIISPEHKEKIEKALDVELTLDESGKYYKCPFNGIDDLYQAAAGYFTNDEFYYIIGSHGVVQYFGSLYRPDTTYSKEYTEPKSAEIIEETDKKIIFTISSESPDNDITLEKRYTVVFENDRWLLDREENAN